VEVQRQREIERTERIDSIREDVGDLTRDPPSASSNSHPRRSEGQAGVEFLAQFHTERVTAENHRMICNRPLEWK